NEDNTIRGLAEQLNAFDLVVDAVGGTGITGALRGSMASVVEQINQAGVAVAAIDIPTGLDADTGQAEGPAVRAQLTVTFAARKSGFDADSAQAYTGRIVLADIGIDAGRIHRLADSGA
ncbi:MAG: NAD(P)H-hydrate epimerase, partial [Planctomycetota bacterium]